MRRYSDNDKHWGPFTFSKVDPYTFFGLTLNSGDDEDPGCNVKLEWFGRVIFIELPAIIKPKTNWISIEPPTSQVSTGYYDERERRYGVTISEGAFLQLFYGAQSFAGNNSQSKSWLLPWSQWRFFRYGVYDLDGNHFWTMLGTINYSDPAVQRCPTARFLIEDYDLTVIAATTRIEELEWHRGTGGFKWLSKFIKPMVRRFLNIDFDQEVGPGKREWKGGLTGTSIEMLPNELHEDAFIRYCNQTHQEKYQSYQIKYLSKL